MTQVLQPPEWARPKGYANGVATRGRQVFVAGMIGWDAQGVFHSDDLAQQVRQALHNVVAVLGEEGLSASIPDGRLRLSPHWCNGLDQVPEVLSAFDRALPRAGSPATAGTSPHSPKASMPI